MSEELTIWPGRSRMSWKKNTSVAKIISNIHKFLTIRHLLHKSVSFH